MCSNIVCGVLQIVGEIAAFPSLDYGERNFFATKYNQHVRYI
jgi:hypothetical protein